MRSFVLPLLCACAFAFTGSARAADDVKKEAPPRRENQKGWEVYARYDADKKAWLFGMLQGTNRGKTEQEKADSMTLKGVDALKKELSGLAEGQSVILQMTLPKDVYKAVADHCAKEKLKLQN